jgi:hypothetical protein
MHDVGADVDTPRKSGPKLSPEIDTSRNVI